MTIHQGQARLTAFGLGAAGAQSFPAQLRPGCKKKYPRAPIIEVAEMAIKIYVDASLSAFRDRVAGWLLHYGIPVPGDTTLEEICRPVYLRAVSAKQ
jgi:hypothetical protein